MLTNEASNGVVPMIDYAAYRVESAKMAQYQRN